MGWTSKARRPAKAGATRKGRFRSALEATQAAILDQAGVKYGYEDETITYTVPSRTARYLIDFRLPNDIIVETKGIFDAADRQKHLLIREQHPDRDIRFVFGNPNLPIYPGSPTTCAEWCDKHGFKWAGRVIPKAWLEEK